MDENLRIIEIGGVKIEVDLRTAKRIDTYKVGDNVKVLKKLYGDTFTSYPGVIVGFDAFVNRPTIIIAYLEQDGQIKFVHLNADTKDVEVCPMENGELLFDKARVLELMDRAIQRAEQDLLDKRSSKEFFLRQFGGIFAGIEEGAQA